MYVHYLIYNTVNMNIIAVPIVLLLISSYLLCVVIGSRDFDMKFIIISGLVVFALQFIFDIIPVSIYADEEILESFYDEPSLVDINSVFASILMIFIMKLAILLIGGVVFGLSGSPKWRAAFIISILYTAFLFLFNMDASSFSDKPFIFIFSALLPGVFLQGAALMVGMYIGARIVRRLGLPGSA